MRIDTVAIGIDFRRAGLAAAAEVAKIITPQAKIALVHAIESPARPPFLVAETMPPAALEVDAYAGWEKELRDVARDLGLNVVRMEVRVGRAPDVIARFAIDVGADLIAVGPHGDRDRSSLLGTTADTLVRNAPMPVYVGARTPTGAASTVIAAVADGALQDDVIRWAAAAATHLGGRVTLAHAIEPASYSHMASLAAAHSHGVEAVERLERKAFLEQTAMHWRAEAERCGADRSRTDTIVDEGVASDFLLECAARVGAALIVLGRHEGRPLGFHALGRTVRHVLHGARCGVLVLPSA